jgi:hypothetical protein
MVLTRIRSDKPSNFEQGSSQDGRMCWFAMQYSAVGNKVVQLNTEAAYMGGGLACASPQRGSPH